MMQEILDYAHLCRDVYLPAPALRGRQRMCFTPLDVVDDPTTDAYCQIYKDGAGLLYPTVRGTDSWIDWRGNFQFRRTKWPVMPHVGSIDAHRGFAACAEALYPRVRECLLDHGGIRNGTLRWLGHSLGGATTLLMGLRMGGDIITFGQPKVAPAGQIVKSLTGRYVRVVNGADAVPRRPNIPFWYGHAGRLVYFPNGGGVQIDPGSAGQFFDRALDLLGRVGDHDIDDYIARLQSLRGIAMA